MQNMSGMDSKEAVFFQKLADLMMAAVVSGASPSMAGALMTRPGVEFTYAFNAYVDSIVSKAVVRGLEAHLEHYHKQ